MVLKVRKETKLNLDRKLSRLSLNNGLGAWTLFFHGRFSVVSHQQMFLCLNTLQPKPNKYLYIVYWYVCTCMFIKRILVIFTLFRVIIQHVCHFCCLVCNATELFLKAEPLSVSWPVAQFDVLIWELYLIFNVFSSLIFFCQMGSEANAWCNESGATQALNQKLFAHFKLY